LKSSFPYLVDISLSNECGYFSKCPISDKCYASPKSKITQQPDLSYIYQVLDVLASSNVFELVFGGESEPTMFKGFENVLKRAKDLNFSIGFTTRNYDFWKISNAARLMDLADSVAFSVNTPEEVEKACVAVSKLSPCNAKFYFQDIFGLKPYSQWLHFLSEVERLAKLYQIDNLTFLGYKDFGFGTSYQAEEYPKDWICTLRDFSNRNPNISIGVDSILVQRYRVELIESGVPERFLVGREGESTCYVDIARKLLKPSSFTNESYPMPLNKNEFLTTFKSF
jgi:hypothetical protein